MMQVEDNKVWGKQTQPLNVIGNKSQDRRITCKHTRCTSTCIHRQAIRQTETDNRFRPTCNRTGGKKTLSSTHSNEALNIAAVRSNSAAAADALTGAGHESGVVGPGAQQSVSKSCAVPHE